MARKNYSEEFRRQAVDLYESTPGATVRGIAEDLGIVRGTLRHWLDVHRTGKKTATDGTLTSSPLQPKPLTASPSGPADQTPLKKIVRLEARVAELEVDDKKLSTERRSSNGQPNISPGRRAGESLCGSPRIVEGFSMRLPGRGPRCSRS